MHQVKKKERKKKQSNKMNPRQWIRKKIFKDSIDTKFAKNLKKIFTLFFDNIKLSRCRFLILITYGGGGVS